MNAQRTILLILMLHICTVSCVLAQTKRSLKGSIRDSTHVAIPGASIRVIAGADTLTSTTDDKGRFSFEAVPSNQVEILVRSIGYRSFGSNVRYEDEQTLIELAAIVLKTDVNMLSEVVIKGKVVPIKVMTDTIEYNADAFVVREGDYVEDLLRQLPGLELDDDGNVKAMGKEMNRLRVNGKDFFTNNVKEFIKKLPAGIFSHVQVIDDYGDEANFTGIKVGEPRKILNLVTKAGNDRGTFGNLGSSAATSNVYGAQGSINFWRSSKQISGNGSFNNANNDAGRNNNGSAALNYSNLLGKGLYLNSGYSLNIADNENFNFSTIETINSLGTINSVNESAVNSANTGHTLNFGLSSNIPGKFLMATLNAGYSTNNSNTTSSLLQNGAIHQDQYDNSRSRDRSPDMNANISYGLSGKDKKRTVSFNLSGSWTEQKGVQDIATTINYYDDLTGNPIPGSFLNRLIDNNNNSKRLAAGFNYSEPLNKAKDTVKKSLEISYSFSMNASDNSLQTRVRDNDGKISFVDSLSNVYTSLFLNHNLRAGYRYGSKKLNYGLGFSFQPNTLRGSYAGRADKIDQQTFNASPTVNFSYVLSKAQSLSMNYSGSSNAPNFNQLQPVPDTRNLQNVVIGNPDLKTSFRHNVNINYSLFGTSSGRSLQAGITASTTQNQVVSNVILIPDTLNSLKQETRFLNVNGNYNLGSNYSISLPFAKRKYRVNLDGQLSYSNAVLFTDNIKNNNRGINYSQNAGLNAELKWISAGTQFGYSYNSNSYTLSNYSPRNLESFYVNANFRFKVRKTFSTSVQASKSFNDGYTSGANNPLLINANVHKSLFKNNRASLSLQINDLLNQANNLNRIINNNMVIESRSRMVSRYILASFTLNLENFRQ